jgi:hypothetical protein
VINTRVLYFIGCGLLRYLEFHIVFIIFDVTRFKSPRPSMLGGSLVTTAWRVLRLRMEDTASRCGGSCEYIE